MGDSSTVKQGFRLEQFQRGADCLRAGALCRSPDNRSAAGRAGTAGSGSGDSPNGHRREWKPSRAGQDRERTRFQTRAQVRSVCPQQTRRRRRSIGTGSPSIYSIRSAFSYFSRILRQCCQVGGSARLTAAKESTASVETSSSGSSATRGSSSRRNSQGQLDRDAAGSFACRTHLQNPGTSFLHLALLQRRHRICRFDSSVLPPLLTGTM